MAPTDTKVDWNGNSRRRTTLYRKLPDVVISNGKQVGLYHAGWNQRPPHMSPTEWQEALTILCTKLIKSGAFVGTKQPTTVSIQHQIQHCVAPASNYGMRQTRGINRVIAVMTGFMTNYEVMLIDQEAEKRTTLEKRTQGKEVTTE